MRLRREWSQRAMAPLSRPPALLTGLRAAAFSLPVLLVLLLPVMRFGSIQNAHDKYALFPKKYSRVPF